MAVLVAAVVLTVCVSSKIIRLLFKVFEILVWALIANNGTLPSRCCRIWGRTREIHETKQREDTAKARGATRSGRLLFLSANDVPHCHWPVQTRHSDSILVHTHTHTHLLCKYKIVHWCERRRWIEACDVTQNIPQVFTSKPVWKKNPALFYLWRRTILPSSAGRTYNIGNTADDFIPPTPTR